MSYGCICGMILTLVYELPSATEANKAMGIMVKKNIVGITVKVADEV